MDYSKSDLGKAKDFVDSQIESVDWLRGGRGRPFYAVGGTWRSFARLHMVHSNYPLSVIHGYRIGAEEAVKFAKLLAHLSTSTLARIKAISRARRETLPFGALVMERLLLRMKPSQVIVSAFGVREGLLYTLLPEEEKRRDPLIAACEELAQLRSRSAEHARELIAWTAPLFSDESGEERRLREAGCLLSDIGWRAHPDYRGEQSLNFVAHAAFAGVDHPGRAFLALAVFYRNQGILSPEPNPFLRELVDKRALKRARILGAAIRAAHMLSAAMPGVIPHTPLSCESGKLVLHMPERFAALEGERLERRFRILAEQVDCEPVIRVGAETQKLAV